MVGCGVGLVRATRSDTAVHMSASFASSRTSLRSRAIYFMFISSEVTWTILLEMSATRGPFLARERMV